MLKEVLQVKLGFTVSVTYLQLLKAMCAALEQQLLETFGKVIIVICYFAWTVDEKVKHMFNKASLLLIYCI